MRLSKRTLTATLIVAGLLSAATPISAQIRRIQGKVVDDNGAPVAGAIIEATIAALEDADFAVRTNDQTWRAQTNSSGDYILTVPVARAFLVTATKEGIGSDQTKVAVERSGLVTANLTLWKARAAVATGKDCESGASIGASARSGLSAATSGLSTGADPGLLRFLNWLEGVHLHTPGCRDQPATEVGGWRKRDLEILLRDIREFVAFLRRAEDERAEYEGRGSARRDQVILTIYGRRLTLDELQRRFYGNQPLHANEVLRRAAVLHADIAIFVPGDRGRYPLVEDGGGKGWRGRSWHWEVGRLLLDNLVPSASDDSEALLWYRATSAHLFRSGDLAELAAHLIRARAMFPRSAAILLDSAYLHQELSSPPIQASAQQLRANDVSVTVNSRRAELQRAEQFFRQALALAPLDSHARVRLGHTLGDLGRHNDAAAELRRALDGKPDAEVLYLAELFLGREEEALGRRDEARRHYQRASELYPNAQSPTLALSRLARQTGDRPSAQRSLVALAAMNDVDRADPWWLYYAAHKDDAAALMERMRQIGR
jgi:tetratricopeptide (TPR) repeat protein